MLPSMLSDPDPVQGNFQTWYISQFIPQPQALRQVQHRRHLHPIQNKPASISSCLNGTTSRFFSGTRLRTGYPNSHRTDIADNELIGYKMDSRSRPSWKTIGIRLKRTLESCKARWLWLKNTRTKDKKKKDLLHLFRLMSISLHSCLLV